MKTNLEQSGPWIGVSGMVVTLFLYGYSAVVLHDVMSLVVLPVVWLLLFALSVAWFTKHPYRVLALPVAATGAWFLAMLS